MGTQLHVLGGSFNFMVSSYRSSKYKPILTVSVRYIAIGGAVYVYVGDTGRKGRGWAVKEEETPSPGAII